MKLTGTLLLATIVSALGGFLFGFDTAVISGTTDALKTVFDLTANSLGFTVSSAIIGTFIGAWLVGVPADRYGRRKTLFVLAVFYLVSAIGSAIAWSWVSFIIFRFIGGLAVGGASVVSPTYIAEISPASLRGRLVAVTQVNIVFGMLIAYFSNYLIAGSVSVDAWRWMLGVEAMPAIAFFLLLFFIPRSPRWLMANKLEAEARNVLALCGAKNVDAEIGEIQTSLDLERHNIKDPFWSKSYRIPILLAIAIAMFNQLSGINAVLYYAPHIFRMAGAAAESSLLQSVAVGSIFFAFTLLALPVIDRFGRKTLMIAGSIGYIISLATAAIVFYMYGTDFTETGGTIVLISILVFIAAHAFGQGTVIWVFLSEIFPNRVRARGLALGSFTHWFMAFIISWTFPIIAEISGGHIFTFYAICMIAQLIWVMKVMPETRGRSLEQIQKEFGIG
ncbi:MAG: sugar porter family MFS transporter [Cyclobacteriaceae bacterium]|nr:sugar porter family MFS transporter [Cyclobacteriaceae bacterium]MDH4298217.1 sugar porter family MFS transporter [Cyclobacteriaceae bacterium]MDH5249483.1 sugar porter family MFS transporter [Cyclobacteriaceae bacterium]